MDRYSFVKNYLSFTLTLICIVGALCLAFLKGTDVSMLLPTLLGLYLGARTTEKVSAHYNARGDVDADLEAVVKEVSDK